MLRPLAFYFVGLIIAFSLIGAIGVYQTGNPFHVLKVYNSNYNTFSDKPAFQSYLVNLMPPFKGGSTFNTVAYGYIGYLFIGCAIYLLAIRFRKATMVGYWFRSRSCT